MKKQVSERVHWTQRPGGREKLSKAIKRGIRAKKTSRAEKILKTKVPFQGALEKRYSIYNRAVETALASGELRTLSDKLAYAALETLTLRSER